MDALRFCNWSSRDQGEKILKQTRAKRGRHCEGPGSAISFLRFSLGTAVVSGSFLFSRGFSLSSFHLVLVSKMLQYTDMSTVSKIFPVSSALIQAENPRVSRSVGVSCEFL